MRFPRGRKVQIGYTRDGHRRLITRWWNQVDTAILKLSPACTNIRVRAEGWPASRPYDPRTAPKREP